MDSLNNKVGLGIVTRNHAGAAVAMVCGSRHHISNPTTAEAMVARTAVELSNTMGVGNFILEGDVKLPVIPKLKLLG